MNTLILITYLKHFHQWYIKLKQMRCRIQYVKDKNNISMYKQVKVNVHSQKKQYYYIYIVSYLKAVRAIAEIWNSILYYYSDPYKPRLQAKVVYESYNHCLYKVQTALNFVHDSFCCKITLISLGSSMSVCTLELQ